jgi:hypothetical protein
LAAVLVLAALGQTAPLTAAAEVPVARILPSGGSQIRGLSFLKPEVPIVDGTFLLDGQLARTGWTLSVQGRPVRLTRAGRFRIRLRATAKRLTVLFAASGPVGEKESQSVSVLVVGGAAEAGGERPSVWWTLSLGYSQLAYSETALVSDFTETALTAKVALARQVRGSPWDLSGNAFVTALPISSGVDGVTARFLGANLRFGYGFLAEPWSLRFSLGLYYTRMSVTDNLFGYGNLLYPQFYPSLRRALSGGGALFAYVKYVPLGEGLIPDFREREIAAGGGYEHPLSGGNHLLFTVDYSDLEFQPAQGVTSKASSLTLGLGYGF